jgi:hypothetical protein
MLAINRQIAWLVPSSVFLVFHRSLYGFSEQRNRIEYPISIANLNPHTMGRRVRACVPCHERKVRCDAVKVGTPCTRCVDNGRTQGCVMLNG